jgi:hypothetical protein
MKKKLIISEKQYKMIRNKLNESYGHQDMVTKILEDLEENYNKAMETYQDPVNLEYYQRAVFEVKISEQVIKPSQLSEYIQKKYNVGKTFTEQLLNDWCDGKIKEGLLSKYVPVNK